MQPTRWIPQASERLARRLRRGSRRRFMRIVRGALPDRKSYSIYGGGGWINAQPRAGVVAERGWKLHVSATPSSAAEVLRRSLPVLATERVAFKVAASPGVVRELNEGDAGMSQIGKVITVYPRDDEQAVRLARALDEATAGQRGPAIPSDRPLRRGSLVHYRYGSFTADDDDDARNAFYRAPAAMPDPFAAAGLGGDDRTRAIGGRYALTSVLHLSASGSVHLAVDAADRRVCVVKRAGRDARALPDGTDARDVLRREAEVMRALPRSARTPELYDVLDEDGDLYVVMEHLPGPSLAERVFASTRDGGRVPLDAVRRWGVELATALGEMHRAGYAFRDLSPRNMILTSEGVRLIDLELVARLGSRNRGYAAGTTGFVSPEQARGGPARVTDDVYGLGAVLFLAATGDDPPAKARTATTLRRIVSEARPDAGDLAATIAQAMDRSLRNRTKDVAVVAQQLVTS